MQAAVELQKHFELWKYLDAQHLNYIKIAELLNFSDDAACEISRFLCCYCNILFRMDSFLCRRNVVKRASDEQDDIIYYEAKDSIDSMRRRYAFEDEKYVNSYIERIGIANLRLLKIEEYKNK